MKNVFIDTHGHIHLLSGNPEAALARADKAGVTKIVSPACNLAQVAQMLPICRAHEGVFTTAGIHPTDLTDTMERDLERVYEYAKNEKKIVAIGEIGLDYYHDLFSREMQAAFLSGQLSIAARLGLPAILHCRAGKNPGENESAFMDLITILNRLRFTNAVAHCFSGNAVEAERLLDMGLLLSFTGIITYDRNESLREIIKTTPLDRIMIETDSPYLTPQAFRDRPNEPAYVIEVAKTIAAVKRVPLEEVARMTTANAERFFGI